MTLRAPRATGPISFHNRLAWDAKWVISFPSTRSNQNLISGMFSFRGPKNPLSSSNGAPRLERSTGVLLLLSLFALLVGMRCANIFIEMNAWNVTNAWQPISMEPLAQWEYSSTSGGSCVIGFQLGTFSNTSRAVWHLLSWRRTSSCIEWTCPARIILTGIEGMLWDSQLFISSWKHLFPVFDQVLWTFETLCSPKCK